MTTRITVDTPNVPVTVTTTFESDDGKLATTTKQKLAAGDPPHDFYISTGTVLTVQET